jgi:LPXTG-site transpeptidase (sortase) family protein
MFGMERLPQQNSFVNTVWRHRYLFLIIFIAVFVVSFILLALIGILPEELNDGTGNNLVSIVNAEADKYNEGVTIIKNESQGTGEEPVRLMINKIGVNTPIINSVSRSISALDHDLTKGIVRYPGSALIGQGNMFLFGHSSTLRVIKNPAYKALNHLDRLLPGDEVIVYSATREYTYRVVTVNKKNEGQAVIDLAAKANRITISTCDSFSGIKQQRIIVEADYVSSRPL